MRFVTALFALLFSVRAFADEPVRQAQGRQPNILFFFVDDLGRYAGVYADADKRSLNDIVKTPNFDRIGREGVVFNNAFVPVASCGPCRASLATGRYFWNCGSGAFLNGKASDWKGLANPMTTLPKFVDRLRESGQLSAKDAQRCWNTAPAVAANALLAAAPLFVSLAAVL